MCELKNVTLMLALVLCSGTSLAETPTVRTAAGTIRGALEQSVVVYKGIPYAAPPVGDLRWKEPHAVKSWKGVREATRFPSQCSQLGPPLPTMPEEPTSEDCLYLNVWTPSAERGPRRPVMVFFYGGQFKRGSASTPLYASGGLTRATGVVLVTVNYRVGPLGFLAHPELSAESPRRISGNYALWDAIAALRWVHANIREFGGDPDNVTIFGQSAGGLLVHYLMVSPPARGLFHAVIVQSNADMGPMRTAEGMAVLADAERAGVAFTKSFGVSSIKELRDLPAQKITESTFEGLPGVYRTNQALPIIDGYAIPDEPYTLYAQGKQADVPLLLGYNEDEGAYFRTPITAEKFAESVHQRYGAFTEHILAAFPARSDEEAARSNTRLWAETTFGWQVWAWARVNSQTSRSKTFFYRFSSPFGNGHGAELPYVFQYPFGGPWNEGQRETARIIAGYWSHFAEKGDPNGTDVPHWPAFTRESETALYLGSTFRAAEVPDLSDHRLIDAYMRSLRPGANAGASTPPQ